VHYQESPHIKRRLLGSSVLSRGPYSTACGSSRVISPSTKFYTLQTPTGLSVMCHTPLPAPHDHPAVVHALHRHLLLQVWAHLCHLL